MNETRKIAAILVSDIVGYSRLTGADEDRILARLRALRSDFIDPTIALHHGRVVKRTGDGALVEFRSVVDAVRCAIEVQNGMIERNAGLPPERRIEFRIGIHLGDVVEESDGDLMGDGVNIAARLEGIAQAGAICLSEDAYRQVSARLDMIVADLGPTQLKNIDRPIRVYSLQVGTPALPKPPAAVKPAPKRRAGMALAAVAMLAILAAGASAWRYVGAERPTLAQTTAVAVLPFDNLGGDAEASRLADGMTEDIIIDLGHFKDFLVIGRSSIMPYKGKPVDVRQVAKDLNVNYVLAGSIQHRDNRLRVTVQLLDASTGAEIWSERWDRPTADLFAVQAEIADKVARTLVGNAGSDTGPIKKQMLAEAKKRQPANLSAYQFVLLAREQTVIGSKEGNAKAWEYVEKAIALDPSLANAYALRAWLILGHDNPWEARSKEFESDLRLALALEPTNYAAQAGLIYYFGGMGKWAELTAQIERALRDNPTNTLVLVHASLQMPYLGRPEEGAKMADLALRRDPHMPWAYLNNLANPYFFSRQFERTIELVDQIPDKSIGPYQRVFRAASYAYLGRTEEAKRAKDELVAKDGEQVMELWVYNNGEVFARTEEQDIEREGFRKLGLRICASAEELKKYTNPKRLPECVKS